MTIRMRPIGAKAWAAFAATLVGKLASGCWNGVQGWRESAALTRKKNKLALSPATIAELRAACEREAGVAIRAACRRADGAGKKERAGIKVACVRLDVPIAETGEPDSNTYFAKEERPQFVGRGPYPDYRLVAFIAAQTAAANRNNVARTAAYYALYREFPELHWALLAHLVSRNGGWSMTDLKGGLLPNLLRGEQIELTFRLLEACNALIFADAYPQLRLYAESVRAGTSLFGLLPQFGVSSFMRPFWELFLSEKDSAALTVALIVNEQHVIQGRVVEDDTYGKDVVRSFAFRAQPLLQLNQVVFPLLGTDGSIRLVGRVLERFERLDERVGFGKCLYAMLFGYPAVLEGATRFAEKVPHTGSRGDYWPNLFTDRRSENIFAAPYSVSQSFFNVYGRNRRSVLHIYSPKLHAAWPDRPVTEPRPYDWFLRYGEKPFDRWFGKLGKPSLIAMSREHLHSQRKLAAAALASELVR